MQPYRLSNGEELNSLWPLVPDHRQRVGVPLVAALPPMGSTEGWEAAATVGPLVRPLDIARLITPAVGLDAWAAAADPLAAGAAEPALHTTVSLLAWEPCAKTPLLRVRFVCGEPDPARLALPAGTGGAGSELLRTDHVSVLMNMDRRGQTIVEVGVTCLGRAFARTYRRFVNAHGDEPGLSPGAVEDLGLAAPTQGPPADYDRSNPSDPRHEKVRAAVWHEAGRWVAELEIPLLRLGQYADAGVVYPTNFRRVRLAPISGAPAGVGWTAGISEFTWSPVRYAVEEFENAGFLSFGPAGDGQVEAQIAQIDRDFRETQSRGRAEFVDRRAAGHAAWRATVDRNRYQTQWLPKAVPGFETVSRGFVLNNSRQLLTLGDGRTLVLAEDEHRLALAAAPRIIDPVRTTWDQEPVALLPDGVLAGRVSPGGGISHASMTLDAGGRLHLVFLADGGCWHASHSAPQDIDRLRDAAAWTVSRIPGTGGDNGPRPYDVERLGAGVVTVLADHEQRMFIARLGEPTAMVELPMKGRCPVLARAAEGGLHLAHEADATIYYNRLGEDLQPRGEPELAAYAVCLFPAIIEDQGKPLIVYQFLGINRARQDPRLYIAERLRAGSGIGCASRGADGRWSHQAVATAGEIMVRRMNPTQYMIDMVRSPHNGRVFPLPDENWRPSVGADGQGVVRAAWQNTTRVHAMTAQWDGSSFGPPGELQGPLAGPTPRIALEKHAPPAPQIKHLLVAEGRLLLDASPAQAIRLDRSDEVYFLDGLAVRSAKNLRRRMNDLKRVSTEPILELPGAGRGGGRDGLTRPTVFRGQDGCFLMLADTFGASPPAATAASDDGVHWKLIDPKAFARLVPQELRDAVKQSGNEEHLCQGYSLLEAARGLEDPLESDPARRFKRLVVEGRVTDPYAPRRVHYSPDGANWTPGPLAIGNNHLNETHVPNIYDPWDKPERRFKIYGRTTTAQGRVLGMLWSGDMVHWSGDVESVVYEDPWSRREASKSAPIRAGWVYLEGSASAEECEHYYCSAWLEAGLYMVLYAVLRADGHKTLRLAFSRDGFHFKRVEDRSLMDTGAPGSFDSGSIDNPFFMDVGSERWMYYSGSGEKHGTLPYTGQHCIGLAAVERRRWSYLSLADAGGEGELLTVAIDAKELSGRGLTVNASGVRPGDLAVGLIDAETNRPIEGFDQADCSPIADGTDAPATWRGKALSQAGARRVRLRFVVRGPAVRLFGFALPRISS